MRRRLLRLSSAVLGLLVVIPAPAGAESGDDLAAYIRAHYSKREVRIPMRDGVELFTSVYIPNDRSRTYPILLQRTPYSVAPYGADAYKDVLGPSAGYAREGMIFAYQDVRGRFMSDGEFVNMRPIVEEKQPGQVDESTDTWDTIEWLVTHVPANSGKVGLWGVSYPGFYASAGMVDSHPALVAVSPQAPIADWFWDDMHHNGAFILPLAFDFLSVFGQERNGPTTEWPEWFDHHTPDGYAFFLGLGPLANANEQYFHHEIAFWDELAAHPNYDRFWQTRNILPHLEGIGAAVMTVGGWFDTEDLYGPLQTYRAVERQNPGITNILVMGPWAHGGWQWGEGERLGDADFGFATAEMYREEVELPFFRHFLKGEGEFDLPEALVFETGADRWRWLDAWPPRATEEASVYLHAGGGLSFESPQRWPGEEGEPHDSFVSDPAKPVPYTMEITAHWARRYMTEDQRFAAWRPDVLVFESEPLGEDTTLAGPIVADLWVATTGRDADWIVKVIDGFPSDLEADDELDRSDRCAKPLGGTQRLVRAEVMRGRFRSSFEEPRPFTPGEITNVRFRLNDVFHTFQRGHRLMVQVQSTWFPFVDRNPQSWVDNIFAADADDFVSATHSVYTSEEHPSRLVVGIVDDAELDAEATGG